MAARRHRIPHERGSGGHIEHAGRAWRHGRAKNVRSGDAHNASKKRGGRTLRGKRFSGSCGASGSVGAGLVSTCTTWGTVGCWTCCARKRGGARAAARRESGAVRSGWAPGSAGDGRRRAPTAADCTRGGGPGDNSPLGYPPERPADLCLYGLGNLQQTDTARQEGEPTLDRLKSRRDGGLGSDEGGGEGGGGVGGRTWRRSDFRADSFLHGVGRSVHVSQV